MANKKRKAGNKGGGKKGAQKHPQQKQEGNPGSSKKESAGAAPGGGKQAARPASNAKGSSGQKQKLTGSARRAAQRKAAKRKRRMMTVWIPVAVIAGIVVVALSLGGGPQGGGAVSPSASVKVSGPARDSELKAGDLVPSFSAPGLDGKTVSWEPGKPTVLTIWAAWCQHCQKELPVLNGIKDSYPDVETLSIVTAQGQSPGPTPEDFVKDNDITIPVAVDDASKKLMNAMGVKGFPTMYFINPDGTVMEQTGGEPTEAQLSAGYEKLAAQVLAPLPSPSKDK